MNVKVRLVGIRGTACGKLEETAKTRVESQGGEVNSLGGEKRVWEDQEEWNGMKWNEMKRKEFWVLVAGVAGVA
jgi:hypothetical protein